MLKRIFPLGLLIVLWVLLPLVEAQEDEAVLTLEQIVTAYQTTAATASYESEWDEETTQITSFMSEDEQFIISFTLESNQTAQVQGDAIRVELEQDIEQTQNLFDLPLAEDEEIPDPDLESDLELAAQIIRVDGELYINLDETDEEFRPGLPIGWQQVSENALLAPETEVALADLTASLANSRLSAESAAAVFSADVATATEMLEDEEIDDQVIRRVLVTLNATMAVEALGVDLALGDLPATVVETLLADANYTIEVWLGAEDGLVHRQITLFSMSGEFEGTALDSELAGVTVMVNYVQERTLELSAFDSTFEIAAPTLGE